MTTMTEGGATASTENDTTSLISPFSELRGLIATGTPGPWREDGRTIVTDAEVIGNIVTDGPDWTNSESDAYWHHNRRLIVAMHQALPSLLDERDRLISDTETLAFERDEFASKATTWGICSDSWKARALSAEGEVEKLKAALEAVKALAVPVKTPTPNLLVGLLSRIHMLARQALSQEIG